MVAVKDNLLFEGGQSYPVGMRYGSQFSVKTAYVPVGEGGSPVTYRGRVSLHCFPWNRDSIRNVKISHKLDKNNEFGYRGESELSMDNPLIISMDVYENRLQRQYYQRMPSVTVRCNNNEETDRFLAYMNSEFNSRYLYGLLERMRGEFKFDPNSNFKNLLDDFIICKRGKCEEFSLLLDYGIKKVGGYSDYISGNVVNLNVRGRLAFNSIPENTHGSHAWVECYYDDKWNIIDPSAFIGSPEEIKYRAINDMKDLYFLDMPGYVIILDDSQMKEVSSSETVRLKKHTIKPKIIECEISK